MLAKNLPFKKIWILPFRILLDAMAAWKGLLTGDGGYFFAILKAHFAFLKWLLFHPKENAQFPYSRKGQLIWCFTEKYDLAIFHKKEKNLF